MAWTKGPHNVLIAIVEVVQSLDAKTFYPNAVPLKLLDFEMRPLKLNVTYELFLQPLEKDSGVEYIVLPDSLNGIYSIAYDPAPEDTLPTAPSPAPASASPKKSS